MRLILIFYDKPFLYFSEKNRVASVPYHPVYMLFFSVTIDISHELLIIQLMTSSGRCFWWKRYLLWHCVCVSFMDQWIIDVHYAHPSLNYEYSRTWSCILLLFYLYCTNPPWLNYWINRLYYFFWSIQFNPNIDVIERLIQTNNY